jgi:hypothetical protein
MYRFAQAAKAGVNTANTVHWQLKSGAGERLYIVEFGIFVSVASTTALQWMLARSTALGTSTTSVAGTPTDAADAASTATVDSAWSAAPTFATGGPFLWTATLPITAGAGYVWVAPNDRSRLVVPASAGICLAASASGATLGSNSFYIVWEE